MRKSKIVVTALVSLALVLCNVGCKRLLESQSPPAVDNLRELVSVEHVYAIQYPDRGFTCDLSALGPGGAELIDNVLAEGHKSGYRYTLGGCGSKPSKTFWAAAEPMSSEMGRHAYCIDQDGHKRKTADSRPATAAECLAHGVPSQ